MEEIKTFLFKLALPAVVAISIKLAVVAQRKGITFFRVITSFITGLGSVYLCSDLVMTHIDHDYISLVIAAIAMSGEKIGDWVVYRLNIETLIGVWINLLADKFKK